MDCDYGNLGRQYLSEAAAISARIHALPKNDDEKYRFRMLYEMRMQLRTVGRELIERGQRYA